jgi:gluconate 2-dehydrogenase alpha chain
MVVHKKVEIVSIGAGWTAAMLAWKLCSAGHRMVSIEQGPMRWANPDFEHNHDGLRYRIRKAMMVDLSTETWTWRPNPSKPSLPIRQYGSFHPGKGFGGASLHWTSQIWRFLESDFRYRSHHIERYGEGKLPEGCTVQDWGITYADLEPYYTAWEYDIGAGGVAGNLNGEIIEGGNVFEEPRSTQYPLPPLVMTRPADMFADACRRLGYHPFPQPTGILSQGYKDPLGNVRAGCIYCGFCTRFGCEVDAKSTAITTHAPAALKTNKWEIRPFSKVQRINIGADGLATGVTYLDADGVEHEQPADVVLVSGYTLTNVRMLLLSRSDRHPNGIGNDRNMVGKNYSYQLSKGPATGLFEGERFNLFTGNGCTQQLIYDFNADNFDHSDLDFIGGASIYAGSGQRDPLTSTTDFPTFEEGSDSSKKSHAPATTAEVGSLAGSGTQWGQAWKDNLRNWDSVVSIGIQGESLPYVDQYLDLDPTYTDKWGQPLLRITFDFHEKVRILYKYLAARCKEFLYEMGPT